MTWIPTIPRAAADARHKACYDEIYAQMPAEYALDVPALVDAAGVADSIVAAHSLLPDVMRHIFLAFGKLLSADLPLTRRQHEMINTLVSSLNRCHY